MSNDNAKVAAVKQPQFQQLGEDIDRNIHSAVSLLSRLSEMNDHLLGATPDKACGAEVPPPVEGLLPHLLNRQEDLAGVLERLDCEVARLWKQVMSN